MESLKLEFARREKGKTKKDMADAIGKSETSYAKKERGEVAFSDDEKITVAKELELTLEQVGDIFFDGKLPKW